MNKYDFFNFYCKKNSFSIDDFNYLCVLHLCKTEILIKKFEIICINYGKVEVVYKEKQSSKLITKYYMNDYKGVTSKIDYSNFIIECDNQLEFQYLKAIESSEIICA